MSKHYPRTQYRQEPPHTNTSSQTYNARYLYHFDYLVVENLISCQQLLSLIDESPSTPLYATLAC